MEKHSQGGRSQDFHTQHATANKAGGGCKGVVGTTGHGIRLLELKDLGSCETNYENQ